MPFDVTIISDSIVEGDETVNLMANSPSNFAVVNPDSATLVIVDDDRKSKSTSNLQTESVDHDLYMYLFNKHSFGRSTSTNTISSTRTK